ncbi:hypothetical protein [Marivirga harenae]|uniref:hypothetical protein n=1 Tax=Marivirga harenae TaxID=2010992 RepID=UPI0026DFA6CA|nr:hypothetical protein [Marivirga harenae]WKV12982.1 hypothetical protein Q3Y49_03960 [Marivirga harenae]
MKKTWLIVSLINFLIASLMGLLLRGAFVWEIEWLEYRNMLHGHSHVALLGWLYLGIFIMIHAKLLPKEKADKSIYTWLFWLTQVTVVGMAISFPIQGYGLFSIIFSTLHIVFSYIFAIQVWKDHNRVDYKSALLLKTAILFLFISTVGVFVVAYIMASKNGANVIYQIAIQFYLHFQFNGWLLFALLALFFNRFGKHLQIGNKTFKRFYWLFLLGNILSYALVLYWGYRWEFSYYVNAIAVILQLLAVLSLLESFKSSWLKLKNSLSEVQKLLLKLLIAVFLTRTVFQFALVFPEMAEMAVLLRLFIIGFIHLNMLGFFTAYLWLEYLSNENIKIYPLHKSAANILLIAFISTELIMFLQGFYYWQELGKLPFFHEGLFYASILLPIAILLFLLPFRYINKLKT